MPRSGFSFKLGHNLEKLQRNIPLGKAFLMHTDKHTNTYKTHIQTNTNIHILTYTKINTHIQTHIHTYKPIHIFINLHIHM